MTVQQLEISIAAPSARRRRPAKPCRTARAHWWFDQMRRIVDDAADWRPRAAFAPEQISLPLARGR